MEENNIVHIPNLSLGNTKSVVNMINRIGGKVIIANSPIELMEAKKIINNNSSFIHRWCASSNVE